MRKKLILIVVAVLLLITVASLAACKPTYPTTTVSFVSEGALYKAVEVEGSTFDMPANPVKTGYTFGGWYLDEAFKTEFKSEEYRLNQQRKDIIVYAKLTSDTVKKFTVSFYSNGGSTVSDQNIENGKLVTKPADPTKAGHVFGGWFSTSNYDAAFDFAAPITADTVLYAKWDTQKFTVDFYMNDGTDKVIESQKVETGRLLRQPFDPSRQHYTFRGWFTDATGNTEFDFTAYVKGDNKVFAQWEIITYKVDFINNYSTSKPIFSTQFVNSGSQVNAPEVPPVREGFKFGGWFKDAKCNLPFNFDTNTITGDTKIYAKWIALVNMTFSANGGDTADFTMQVAKSEAATDPTLADPTKIPARVGYTFEGWYTDASCTAMFDFSAKIYQDTTVYAKWYQDDQLLFGDDAANQGKAVIGRKDGVTSIVMPDTYMRMPVTSIASDAFKGMTDITSITFNSNIKSIGDSAFEGCTGLTGDLMLPEGLVTLGDSAFKNCTSLTSLTISDSVTTIGDHAFQGCEGLTDIIISDSVTTIGSYAFSECKKLISVTIGSGLTTIIDNVFNGCSALVDLTIGSNVTTIGESAFMDCTNLEILIILDSVTTIGNSAFKNCANLKSVIIPNNVTEIGAEAFSYCGQLDSVTIGSSVTTIGKSAFMSCTSLATVNMATSVITIGDYAFLYCESLISIVIPSNVTTIGVGAFSGCDALTSATFENAYGWSVQDGDNTIELDASDIANNATLLKTTHADKTWTWVELDFIYQPDTVNNGWTVKGYKGSSDVVAIPNSYLGKPITSIATNAFKDNTTITSVTLPTGLVSIEEFAFAGCIGLTGTVTIPNSVTTIGASAFSGCTGLESVTIGEGLNAIADNTFEGCTSLTNVIIGRAVSLIGASAFFGCSALASVTFTHVTEWKVQESDDDTPEIVDVTDVNANAIMLNQTYVAKIWKVSPSVFTLDDDTVNGGWMVTSYIGTDSVAVIPSTYLGKKITSIKTNAFNGNTLITEITIPNTLVSIGINAFAGCTSLTSVIFPDDIYWAVKQSEDDKAVNVDIFDPAANAIMLTQTHVDKMWVIGVPDFLFEEDMDNNGWTLTKSNITGDTVVVPDQFRGKNVTSIKESVFLDNTVITSVTLPNTIVSIGKNAFKGCTALTSVNIPSGVTSISEGAFYDCTALAGIILPEALTSIGLNAFRNCKALTSIVIPQQVTVIDNFAFVDCGLAGALVIPSSVTTLGDGAFAKCSAITELTIGTGITAIALGTFYGTSITTIIIPDNVTSIGVSAFGNNTALTSVTIGIGVELIDKNAFAGCTSLTSVTFPADTTWTVQDGESGIPEPVDVTDATLNATNFVSTYVEKTWTKLELNLMVR